MKQIQNAIDTWLASGDSTKLKEQKESLDKLWAQYSEEAEDWRGGSETYGYGSDAEIRSTMIYISDRWKCAYRIRWILDGIEIGVFDS